MNHIRPSWLAAGLTTALLLGAAAPASAQLRTTFSIDGHGPTNSTAPCGGGAGISPADILQPDHPERIPALAASNPVCVGVRGGGGLNTLGLPNYPGLAELDALSYGVDAPVQGFMNPGSFEFSVDEFAWGLPFGGSVFPSVRTEWSSREGCASVFCDLGIPTFPYPPGSGPLPSIQFIDGNGLTNATGFTAPGFGLLEPNPPGSPPDAGDNVDAFDFGAVQNDFVLFSLDGNLADPLSGVAGSNSALANGYLPGQILGSNLSGLAPVVWATHVELGLSALDDIDALAVWDNGNRVYDPVDAPMAWNNGGGDMVLFSLRRGSPAIGQLDSRFGTQIEECDVLMPPVGGGANPAIFLPGEALGLATRRDGTARFWGGVAYADDLDALDVTGTPLFNCSVGVLEDAVDIYFGVECDQNKNGVPDPCELETYCTAGTSTSGCQALIAAAGVPSASQATGFTLSASSVEGGKAGSFFFGANGRQANPWGNGTSYQCVVPPVKRGGSLAAVGTLGLCDGFFSEDLNALWTAAPAKNPGSGATVQAQLWYRDSGNTSNQTTSLSDAIEFAVCP